METNNNESFTNYGRVGFELEVDTRLAPLMLLRDRGRPNIGFGFHDGLSFHLVVGCFGLGSAQEMKTMPSFVKVSIRGNLGSKLGVIRKYANNKFCELEFKNQ